MNNSVGTIDWCYVITGRMEVDVGPIFAEGGQLYATVNVKQGPTKESISVLSSPSPDAQ